MQTAHDEIGVLLEKICALANSPAVDELTAQVSDLCARYMDAVKQDVVPGVRLTPNERGILDLLYAKRGQTVKKWALFENTTFRKEGFEPGEKNVDVYVCRLRKKLEGSAYTIDTDWGRGYRLINKSEQEKAA